MGQILQLLVIEFAVLEEQNRLLNVVRIEIHRIRMLKNNPAPPTNPGITSRLHPSYLVTIEKTLLNKRPSGISNNRILLATSAVSLSHQHIIRNDRTYSSLA